MEESSHNANISEVATKLQQQEDAIVNKAKQVEREMNALKEQKLELLLKMFKEQLMKDFQKDIDSYKLEQEAEQKRNIEVLSKEKEIKIEKLLKLQRNIGEQIETLKLMKEDLEEKKEEIETSYQAAQEYLKNEAVNNLVEFQQRCRSQIDAKVKEFRGQVSLRNL